MAWCSSADLTADTDSAGNPRPARLRVGSAARGDGQVVESRNDLRTATGQANTLYNGQVSIDTLAAKLGGYQLTAASAGSGETLDFRSSTVKPYVFNDIDNVWGNYLTSDSATVGTDAHWGAMKTYEYFKVKHGRNGIKNDGKGAKSRVHYGRSYANAFWDDRCFCMTYGDGDGIDFGPLVSLDVAGHEMAHGVTSVTARLEYVKESGGLNEATSDIFGTLVEWFANSTVDTPDYYIGETVMTRGRSLRYMHDPIKDGRSPSCYVSNLGTIDVHYSSGVANHFFYLLAEGSAPSNGLPSSPLCNNVAGPLAGIGRDKAGAVWYRALTVYMTSLTNYAGARVATVNAATDLYGANQTAAVKIAWTAVGVI